MKTEDNLEQQLKRACLKTSAQLDARILADAGAALRSVDALASGEGGGLSDAPPKLQRSRSRATRIAVIASGLSVAALGALTAFVFLGRPAFTWAQVAEAVKTQPWMHSKAKLPDGTEAEGWISFTRGLDASRQGEHAHFQDHRLGVIDTYNPADKSIYRTADMTNRSRSAFLAFSKLFEGLFSGKENLEWSLPGTRIAGEKRRTVTEDGIAWMEIELAIQDGDAKEGESQSVIFRIDPKTRLPVQMTVNAPGPKPERVVMTLDYPNTGPEDIYALGVPRDAKIIDQVPKGDLKRILESIKRAREQFDDYRALEIWRIAKDSWYRGTPMRIWYQHDPSRRRLDYGFEYPDFKLGTTPDEKVDQRAWWLEHSQKFWYVTAEIQDGAASYDNIAKPEDVIMVKPPFQFDPAKWPKPQWKRSSGATPDGAFTLPVNFAYPDNLLSGRGANAPRLRPAEGKDGLLIVEFGSERYTIDPARGQMAVRTERDVSPSGDDKPTVWSMIVEESARSPKGFWYPTRIRSIEQRDGKPTREDSILQFYLDFEAKMPDSVFKPLDHVITDPDELK